MAERPRGLGRGLDALLEPPITPPARRRPRALACVVAGRGAVRLEVAGVHVPTDGRLGVDALSRLANEINAALGR